MDDQLVELVVFDLFVPDAAQGGFEQRLDFFNVDGGVTDNDPFDLAHDFLASQNPTHQPAVNAPGFANPSTALDANCAVITVARRG